MVNLYFFILFAALLLHRCLVVAFHFAHDYHGQIDWGFFCGDLVWVTFSSLILTFYIPIYLCIKLHFEGWYCTAIVNTMCLALGCKYFLYVNLLCENFHKNPIFIWFFHFANEEIKTCGEYTSCSSLYSQEKVEIEPNLVVISRATVLTNLLPITITLAFV